MLSYSSRPPDPALAGDNKWRDMWLDRLENEPFLPAVWLKHQRRDAYWKRGSVCEDFSAIKAATLPSAAGATATRTPSPVSSQGIERRPRASSARGSTNTRISPCRSRRIGFLQEALRWWDRWLKDIDTGVESDPAMRLYLMDSVPPRDWYEERPGRWIARRTGRRRGSRRKRYPSAWAAHCRRLAGSPPLSPSRRRRIAAWPAANIARSGSARNCPATSAGRRKVGLLRRRAAEAALDIVGAPVVRLKLAADRPRAMVAVRLCDVQPDGASTRITYGVLNLCHRNSHEFPETVVPGETMEIAVRLDDIAYQRPARPPVARGDLVDLLADGLAVARSR